MSDPEDADRAAEARARSKAAQEERARSSARAAAKATTGGSPPWSQEKGEPVSEITPHGYSSFQDALERANDEWGRIEAWSKLLGVLAARWLGAFVVDKRGTPLEVDADYWRGNLRDFDPDEGTIRNYPPINGIACVVFLTDELDDKLPYSSQKTERANAALGAPASSSSAPSANEESVVAVPAALRTLPNDCRELREAVVEVYKAARAQNTAIPNNLDIAPYVHEVLERKRLTASANLIGKVAKALRTKHRVKGDPFYSFFLGPGERAQSRNLKPARDLRI